MQEKKRNIQQYRPADKKGSDQELIEKSVEFINEKANETLYKGSVVIGEYLLKHFFNDDISLASSKNPRKPKSYKALCSHKALSVPYSTLTIMVRVAAQEKFFKLNQIDIDKLGYTHKAALIRLENSDRKLNIARQCIDESLSTRQLNDIVKKTRKRISDHRKEDQEDTAFSNIMKIEQLIGRSEKSELVTDINKIRSMKTKTREDLKQKAEALLEVMSQTTRDCKKLIKNLGAVEKEKSR